jgi:hypothetical protein
MTENLLTPSVIKLFGRVMNDLQFNYDASTVVSGYNNLLQRQLANGSVNLTVNGVITPNPGAPPPYLDTVTNVSTMVGLFSGMEVNSTFFPGGGGAGVQVFAPGTTILTIGPGNTFTVSAPPINPMPPAITTVSIAISGTDSYDQTPKFARIYGFSFEGAYYGMPRPSIYLVHGPGTPVGNWNTNSTMEQAGVAAREWDFSGFQPAAQDIMYWEYEKGDLSIRLDPEAGPFEQILLMAALRGGADMADRATPRSGQGLDRSGQGLDRSGQGLDIRSGQGLRR